MLFSVAALGAASLSSCSSTPACGTNSCTGCCDARGTCVTGNTGNACGAGGLTCSSCAASEQCLNGTCQLIQGTNCSTANCANGCCNGNSCVNVCPNGSVCSANHSCVSTHPDGGGQDGGGPMDGGTCTGCVLGGTCIPLQSETNGACGFGGATCTNCGTNGSCQAGSCVSGCGPSNCAGGCCAGSSCVLLGNESNSQCGANGGACGGCTAPATCNTATGACASPPPGTVTVVSSGNALPPPFQGAISDFASDNSGGAFGYENEVVELIETTTTTGGSGLCDAGSVPLCTPCPSNMIFTSTAGNSYCDGFAASNTNGTAFGDDFDLIGQAASNLCAGQFNDAGLATLRGVWFPFVQPSTMTTTWSIALTACSDVGVGTPYSGAGVPPAGNVATLLGSAVNGSQVVAHGVVVASWTSTAGTAFGFILEDPNGAQSAGIAVNKAPTSLSTAGQPAIGQAVTVTGTFNDSAAPNYRIDL